MLPLAFNVVLPQSLRRKPQFALAVLPIGGMFSSFWPIFVFAEWLGHALGIPHNAPIKNHPNGVIWIAVFLSVMVFLVILGYLLGWLANGLISRYVLGWPASKVIAVYMRSEVPPEWLNTTAARTANGRKDESALQKWEAQRAAGALRFILTRGVLTWGAPMFLVMYVVPAVSRGTAFTGVAVLFQAILWAGAGAGFGGAIWLFSEWNYRNLKAKNEP